MMRSTSWSCRPSRISTSIPGKRFLLGVSLKSNDNDGRFANSIDSVKVDYTESLHLDLHCLHSSL